MAKPKNKVIDTELPENLPEQTPAAEPEVNVPDEKVSETSEISASEEVKKPKSEICGCQYCNQTYPSVDNSTHGCLVEKEITALKGKVQALHVLLGALLGEIKSHLRADLHDHADPKHSVISVHVLETAIDAANDKLKHVSDEAVA